MSRGSYSRRRTEIKRDEMRETIRLNRIDAHENEANAETIRNCERFFNERGIGSETNDFRKVTTNSINVRVEQRVIFVRKEQDALPARSLKAAVLREIVMEARRRGALKMAYQTEPVMAMTEWGVEDE